MNKKIKFYILEINHSDIFKHIFTAILSESINNTKEWLEKLVPLIIYDLDLDLILDHKIISEEDTTEELVNFRLGETINGKIIFDDDIDYQLILLKAENYDLFKKAGLIKYPEPAIEVRKEYESCWIDLFGNKYLVTLGNHNTFASDWLEENDYSVWRKITESFSRYHYEELEDRGWIRILGWKDPPVFVLPNNITPKQKVSLREYCIKNELKYKDFPEILKS